VISGSLMSHARYGHLRT